MNNHDNLHNVLFLDIDGVLNDNKRDFSLESIIALKKIINRYCAKIVLITSKQGNGTVEKRNKIKNLLKQFDIDVLDFINPNFEGDIINIDLSARVLGIIHYLKNNPVDNYLIIDDDYHNDYKLLCLNHYKTKMFKGLSDRDLTKIKFRPVNLNNFKYVNYRYRQLGTHEYLTTNLIKILKKVYENKNN